MKLKKNFREIFILTAFINSILFTASCSKEEGVGGRASIKGKLQVKNFFSKDANTGNEDVLPNERVYITYGDEKYSADDDARTGYDGTFEFKFLRKGNYKIFAYSLDPSLTFPSSLIPIVKEISITDLKQEVIINDLVVYKMADDGGSCTLSGKLFARDYNSTFTSIKGEYYLPDEYVYLVFGDGDVYDARNRTNANGAFAFHNLRKGKYKIYAFSKDSTGVSPSGIISVSLGVELTENGKMHVLPDLVVIK